MKDWVFIERASEPDAGKDVLVGPYPSEQEAAHAMEHALLIEHLLQPDGGGGTDCYTVQYEQGQEPDADMHLVDLTDPDHTGFTP